MTRKHFTELARALYSIRPSGIDSVAIGEILLGPKNEAIIRFEAWFEAVRAVADTCESANPRFDRGRFIAACEGA